MNGPWCGGLAGNDRRSKDVTSDGSPLKIPDLIKIAPEWSALQSTIAEIPSGRRTLYWVLFFYRQDFNALCAHELVNFSDRIDEFTSLRCNILAISAGSDDAHRAWSKIPRKEGGLEPMRIPMLSDENNKLARAYGVFNEATGTSHQALFVIDNKMILRHVTINDITIPRSPDEVLRVIAAARTIDGMVNDFPE